MTEQLKDKNGNIIKEPYVCKYCGETFDASLKYSMKLEQGQCFACWFWQQTLKDDAVQSERVVIVNGEHYHYADDTKYRSMAGFGGQEFRIQFNDGRKVVTHNLWYQGKIPAWIKGQFPDNAIFLPRERRAK